MLNQCQFIGHLGAAPDVKRTADGRPIVNLSLGVTEKWRSKDTGERQERTEWIRIVIFSEGLCKIAEQYLSKGSKIYVSGKMQTRKYQAQDGSDRYSTEITLQGFESKLVMLDSRNESSQSNDSPNEYARQTGAEQPGAGDISDEIPFSFEWRA